MNAPLRRVGVVVLVLFGLLFANLNWVQAYKADEYRNSPYNARVQVAEYERQRGVIEAQGKALARSVETDGELKHLREYPFGGLYAHVVGYKAVNMAATDIERSENDFLAGTSNQLFADRVRDMFTGDDTSGGNVVLSLSLRAQQTAFDQLRRNRVGARRGAVVALDPRTGAVQALVSMPTFDPNPLVSHDTEAAAAAYRELERTRSGPLKNRAMSETLSPGSTFKVIDAAAALENGYQPETSIPAGSSYTPPQTTVPIRNAASSICPESRVTLKEALTESCNTGFARLGVELGAEVLKEKARDFGFEDEDLVCGRADGDDGIKIAASRTGDMKRPDGAEDPAVVAQSAIGQNDVQMTPIQGAMIAATVANDGRQMRPYVVQQLLGPDRRPIPTPQPDELRRPIDDSVARDLRDMMISVVENGTGRNARIEDHEVGGKTGTAEAGEGVPEHGWFIGFVMRGDQPLSAVGVVLENAGSGGSAEAARIGGAVMRSVIRDGRRGGD